MLWSEQSDSLQMNWNSQQHLTDAFIIASSYKSIRLYMQINVIDKRSV